MASTRSGRYERSLYRISGPAPQRASCTDRADENFRVGQRQRDQALYLPRLSKLTNSRPRGRAVQCLRLRTRIPDGPRPTSHLLGRTAAFDERTARRVQGCVSGLTPGDASLARRPEDLQRSGTNTRAGARIDARAMQGLWQQARCRVRPMYAQAALGATREAVQGAAGQNGRSTPNGQRRWGGPMARRLN